MKQKLVNKHIIRAISLGLTAVMASTPVTALAAELEQLPEEEKKEEESTQNQSKFAQTAEVVQKQLEEAENSLVGENAVSIDDTAEEEKVVLPSTEEAIEDPVPSAFTAADEETLKEDSATLTDEEGNSYEIEYCISIENPSVQENVATANTKINEANIALDNTVVFEEAANAKTEILTKDVEKAEEELKNVEDANEEVKQAEEELKAAVDTANSLVNKEEVTKEEADTAIENIQNAVDTVEKAEETAKTEVEEAQAQLDNAQREADAAKAMYENAKKSLASSKEEVTKAYEEMVKAEEKAEALKAEVDEKEKDYAKALELKRLYEQMKEVASKENPNSDYITEESKEEFSSDFGREKASPEYWSASFEYFEAYLDYVYGAEKDYKASWTSQGEHFAKNNVYEVSFTDDQGQTVTKFFNYHLNNEEGDISIYEKKSQEVYGEKQYQTKESDVVVETGDGRYVIKDDASKIVEETDYLTGLKNSFYRNEKLTLDESSLYKEYTLKDILVSDPNGDQTRDVKEETVIETQQNLENLVDSLSEAQYIQLTYSYLGSSPMTVEVNSGVNVSTLINEIFRAPLGDRAIKAVVKEKCTLQKAVVETVRGDYTLEYQNNDFISVKEFRKPGNIIPTETARKNYIYEIIEERMATINGEASNIEIKEVYSNGRLAGYSFTYDVVAERVGINLEERVYTATTYNDKRDLLMERKDTSQDQTILDAMNAAAAYRKKQDAAAVALAAVKEAKADVIKAQKELKSLEINDEEYQKAVQNLEAAKAELIRQQKELDKIEEEVKEIKEEYEKVKKELEEKSYPEEEGTEPDSEDSSGKGENQNPKNDSAEEGENTFEGNEEKTQDKPSEDELNNQEDRKEDLSKEENQPTEALDTDADKQLDGTTEEGRGLADKAPARQPEVGLQNTQSPVPENTGNDTIEYGSNINNLQTDTQEGTTVQQVGVPANQQQNNDTLEENVDEMVLVADEEVPLGGDLSQMMGEDQQEKEDEQITLTQLEEEAVPLANTVLPKESMSWWWLLIVALLGATGYKMYEKYQEKKELKEEK